MRMKKFLLLLLLATLAHSFELPKHCTQCVVGTAKDWNSSHVTLQLYQKSGNSWQKVGAPWSGRLGKNGLVWGLGLHPNPAKAPTKREGDGRTPAGVFAIGGAWGSDASIRKHPRLFYRQVTSRDLWVEDPASPSYNRHVLLTHEPATPWEKQQQMKQNDPAHQVKLFIAHNAPPKVVKGAGSSIFFHIWRNGGGSPSAGCTTMEEAKLRAMIAAIDPTRHPLYIILPSAEFQQYRQRWSLP
jgi:L,D-peptidoglycan transpeptidase YkuD (ErfK/YbiS/YcfS/YnhG family)